MKIFLLTFLTIFLTLPSLAPKQTPKNQPKSGELTCLAAENTHQNSSSVQQNTQTTFLVEPTNPQNFGVNSSAANWARQTSELRQNFNTNPETTNSTNQELSQILHASIQEISTDLPEPTTRPSSAIGNIQAQIAEITESTSHFPDPIKQALQNALNNLSNFQFLPNASLSEKMIICENMGGIPFNMTEQTMIFLKTNYNPILYSLNFDIFGLKLNELIDSIIRQNDPENSVILIQSKKIGETKNFVLKKTLHLFQFIQEANKQIEDLKKSQETLQNEIASMKQSQNFVEKILKFFAISNYTFFQIIFFCIILYLSN